jgi:hypothetical protein
MSANLKYNAPAAQIFGRARDSSYPSPIEMLHVSILHCGPGIDELVNFYQVVLNMRLVFKVSYPTFEFIAISADDENHRLGFVNVVGSEWPGEKGASLSTMAVPNGTVAREQPLRACRLEHTSWLYRSFEDVLLTAKRIRQDLKIWPRTSRHNGVDLTIDYNDPDGNRVELLSQTPSKAQILFRIHQRATERDAETHQYADFYMSVDIEKMIGLYDAGTPIKSLMDRDYCRALVAEGKL